MIEPGARLQLRVRLRLGRSSKRCMERLSDKGLRF